MTITVGEAIALLTAARQYVPSLTVLAGRIDAALGGDWPDSIAAADRDLVWERYGNGFAWFKADLTDPDRSPQAPIPYRLTEAGEQILQETTT